jgi:(E)-4-hydroxy-3-methylbut-2-enyl-diphosphate synthase
MFGMDRRLSKQVMVGQVAIGGGAPITVQSMLNVPAHDIAGNVAQALRLQACGCDIIRTAVPDKEAVALVAALKEALTIPMVADIHFDYQ